MDDRQTTGINTDLGQNEDPYAGFGHDPQLEVDAGTPRVRSDIDFLNLPEGSDYFGPDNRRRTKHYTVTNDADFMRIPEGAPYIGPDGVPRDKPNYGDIGFTAQALHDMAVTPEAKTEALRRSYGDKVKVDEAGPYVQEDDGTIRRPGVRSLKSALGTSAAETLPAIGMVGGGLLGGAGGALVGSAVPGPGTVLGGAGGASAGAIGGAMARQANNVILSLLGIHQPVLDQLHSMGQEGLYTAGGEVAGRTVGKLAQYAKGPSRAGTGLPNDFTEGLAGAETPAPTKTFASRKDQIAEDLGGVLESMGITPEHGPKIGIGKFSYQTPGVRSLLGVNDEGLERLLSTQGSGIKIGPSAAFPDAPLLTKIEQLDQAFNKEGGGRFVKSAREGYERGAKDILESPGINDVVKEPLTSSTQAVSYKEAGEKAVQGAQIKMAAEDHVLEQEIAKLRQNSMAADFQTSGAKEGFDHAYESNMLAARNLIKSGVDQIRLDAQASMQEMTHRLGSNDLVNNIADSFRSYNAVVRNKASHYYRLWDEAGGARPVDVTGLQNDAAQFFEAMPDNLAGKYPIEIRLLNKLVAPEGEEAITMTAGELHHLRSWMRHGIDYDDLASGMRNGALKNFEGKVNRVIQALPESDILNKADAFYKDTIPYLDNQMIKATMTALKGGTGVDPEVAANIFFKAGRAEDVNEARRVLGPNLWNAIEAAHIQSLVNQSKSFGDIDAKKFASLINNDEKRGMLQIGYSSPKAQELMQVARNIERLDGKLEIRASEHGDTLDTILQKAQAAKTEADRLAEIDPLRAFEDAAKEMRAKAALHRAKSPLTSLFGTDMSYKGEQAAKNILSNEDRIIAASNYFGKDSDEFQQLRKVFVRDFLQREFPRLGQLRGELSQNPVMTENVQTLMFPGWTMQGMKTLAKDLEFAFSAATVGANRDTGASLKAAAQIFNPPNIVPGLGKIAHFPPVQFVNRVILGKYYAALMEGVSNPAFAAWLTKNLESKNPQIIKATRQVLDDRLKTSPWIGRALGQESVPSAPDQTQDQYAQ